VIFIYLGSYLRKTGLLASTFGLGGGLKTFTPHGLLQKILSQLKKAFSFYLFSTKFKN
jgi:hypothetical protein